MSDKIIFLFLVKVDVPQVSSAVRYLDKPQWRAVTFRAISKTKAISAIMEIRAA